MKTQLQQRLQTLKTEYTSGQKVLADLEAKQTEVQHTLLRIQGAIQVLEEELAKADDEELAKADDADGAANGLPTVLSAEASGVLPHPHG